jgi:hypothetical protein
MLYILPESRLAVVILSNLESAPERLETVTAVGRVVLGKGPGG